MDTWFIEGFEDLNKESVNLFCNNKTVFHITVNPAYREITKHDNIKIFNLSGLSKCFTVVRVSVIRIR